MDRTGHRLILATASASSRPSATTATWQLPQTLPLTEYSQVKVVWTSMLSLTNAADTVSVTCPDLAVECYDTSTKTIGRTLGIIAPKLISGGAVAYYAIDSDNAPLDMQAGNYHTSLTLSLQFTNSKAAPVITGEWTVMLEFTD